MTRYYRSRHAEHPAVYVQDEGQWRGYARNGTVQRAAGSIPDAILSRMVEVGPTEGEALLAAWRVAATAAAQSQPAALPQSAPPTQVAPQPRPPQAAAPRPQATARQRSATPRPEPATAPPPERRSRRLPYILTGVSTLVVIVVVVLVLLFTGILGGQGQTSPPGGTVTSEGKVSKDDLVATVGDLKISRQRLDEKTVDFEAQYPTQVPNKTTDPDRYRQFQQDVLDYLITYELVALKAAELQIAVTDDDVQNQMALIRKVSFGGDQAAFDAAIQKQGLTMAQFERTYRESLLFDKVFAEVTKAETVTDADVQAYYDKHKSDTYQGKPLEDVEDEAQAAALTEKQRRAWTAWLTEQKKAVGVSYANGWTEPAGGGSLAP